MTPKPSRFWVGGALVFALGILAGAGVGGTFGAFSGTASNGSNSFTATSLGAPTGLTITWTPTVNLSWTATSSTFATGYQILRGTASGGPYTQIATVTPRTTTSTTDTPGAGTFYYVVRAYFQNWVSSDSNQVVRQDSNFDFKDSTSFTGTNCDPSQVDRDMEQGYTANGPEESWSRTGGVGTATFCTNTFPSGESVAAGTTTVSAYFANSAGSTCNITATVYKNGVTSLGSGTTTIPGSSAKTLRTWSFATSSASFASGDRLNVTFVWQAVKACDSTDLFWNGASSRSSITFPTIS